MTAPDEVVCEECGAVVHITDAHSPHEPDCTHRHPPMQHGCVGCACDRIVCEDCCEECRTDGQLSLEGVG